jgi:endonuclease/exonuclease/phosphatase family metal-dependent hydrolase
MKLITWNIQWALGVDGRCDPTRIVAEARRLADFDVLCLQEVSQGFFDLDDSKGRDQFAEFTDLLPGYTAVEGAIVDVPGPQGRRRFGNMLFSRLPVGMVLRHSLPWEADATENMPRGLIEAVVESPFGPVRVMTTHVEWSSEKLRIPQVEAIRSIHRQACERCDTPRKSAKGPYGTQVETKSAILTGDFNMQPDDPLIARVQAPFEPGVPRLVDAWRLAKPKIPHPPSFLLYDRGGGEAKCLDFIFVTEDLAPRVSHMVYDQSSQASDHQPVLLELNDR